MPCRYTYPQIAMNHTLWMSSCGAKMRLSENQFDRLSTDQKVAMLVNLMGPAPSEFRVSADDVELGLYTARTAQEAMDACAQDAGYRTEAEWTLNRHGHLAPLVAKEVRGLK